MKIVRYQLTEGRATWGVLEEQDVYPASGDPFAGLHRSSAGLPLSAVSLLPPVAPGKIVCVGLNYAAHVTERDPNRKVPLEPVIFMKPTSAIVGPMDSIEIAYPDHETHHEAELVVVIGRTMRDVPASAALDHVLGYTCGNDVSDRTLQQQDGQWLRAKGFRTYCPVGPCIETELDLTSTHVESRVNGQIRQSQTTAAMLWDVPALLAYLSEIMTIDPGDIVMTGTPEGVGPLVAGDICEIGIPGIGILANPVVNAAHRPAGGPAAHVTSPN